MGFFDDFISGITSIVNAPLSGIEDFFSSISISDITDIPQAIYALANYLYQALVSFASLISNAMIEIGTFLFNSFKELAEALQIAAQVLVANIIENVYGIFSWLTDWTNAIYTGFRSSINDTVELVETHVTQFSNAVVDKTEKLLIMNSMMAVLKGSVERGDFSLSKTPLQMAGAGLVSAVAATFFKGLIP